MSNEIYHKCIGRLGYAVATDQYDPNMLAELKRECTITTTVLPAFKGYQKPKTYALYYLSRDRKILYLPRYYALEKLGPPDYISLANGRPISVTCPFDPMPHQAAAIEKLDAIFNAESELGGGGVLSLPCGYGKTFCAIRTVCKLGLSALIIVPTECLMDQWIEAIKQFAPGARVGYIQRDHVDVDQKDFVVAMLHSISLKDYKPSTFDQFGITIYDECHHLGSESFSKSMMKIRTKFTLGLSATPFRRDGLSPVFFNFLGPLIHKERRSGSNVVLIKKFNLYSTSSHYTVLRAPNGTKNTSGMVTAISMYHERNQLIVNVLKELIGQGRRILLLSSRKQHLHDIKDMLDSIGIRRPEDGHYASYGFYYGKTGMSREKHKALRNESAKCDIVLGISILAQEGLDIPDRNTLIWATPPGIEIEQPVGRILRKFHKSLHPIVVDLVDHTGNFTNHARERDKWYREEGYVIQKYRVNLGTNDWHADIMANINQIPSKKEMERMAETKQADDSEENSDEETGLVLDRCILDSDEDDTDDSKTTNPKPKAKPKITSKANKAKTQPKTISPLKQCLLPDPIVKTADVSRSRSNGNGPTFSKCML